MARLRKVATIVYDEVLEGYKGQRKVSVCVSKYVVEVLMYNRGRFIDHKTYEIRDRELAEEWAQYFLNNNDK